VLPELFYLNDVLVTPGLVQSLISVCWFTTDNFYSMEFDSFGLSGLFVKGPTTCMLARCDNTSLLYTLLLPTLPTPTPRVVPYILATATSWHRCLGHPTTDVLSKMSSSSSITCPQDKDDSLCHACQFGCPFLPPLPESLNPLTSYIVTSEPPLL
jgi:hypothetical protein